MEKIFAIVIHTYFMTARKIEIDIFEILNAYKKKEEPEEINMSSTQSSEVNNTIVSTTIQVTKAKRIQLPEVSEVQEVPRVPETTECNICCEKYNKSNRMPIKCASCDFEACRQCHSTFILDASNTIPNCMSCHKELQREFLVENFTQKFVTQDWKKHREQIILQKERALLPTRQPVAEMVRQKDTLSKEMERISKEMIELRHRQTMIQREINNIDYRVRMGPEAENPTTDASSKKSSFIRPCPNSANNCRGFLSTQWKCNLCNMWACKDCHEIKGETQDAEHECNPDNLASAKLIDAETRPCPKCGARVFKISGCNQMFCTACNDCAFDWVTGRIETKIHNPHYFEFQRQRNGGQAPRVIGDILCGREVDNAFINFTTSELFPVEEISRMYNQWKKTNNHMYYVGVSNAGRWEKFYEDCLNNKDNILSKDNVNMPYKTARMSTWRKVLFRKLQFREICRIIIEIRQVTLPHHQYDPIRYNEKLGVKYLLGELTEKDFATGLQRADKKMQKTREMQNIITMVLNTSTDIIFRFAEYLRASREVIQKNTKYVYDNDDFVILDEIRELFNYANTCFERVSKNYQSTKILKIGTSLEPNYWEDNGIVIQNSVAAPIYRI